MLTYDRNVDEKKLLIGNISNTLTSSHTQPSNKVHLKRFNKRITLLTSAAD